MSAEIKGVPFHLADHGADAFFDLVKALDDPELYDAVLLDHDSARNIKQNKLMWRWNTTAAEAQHTSPNWQHGEWKLLLLLPMMKGWPEHYARATQIQSVMDDMQSYKHKVFYAFDAIRSKDLKIGQFAEALQRYQMHYAEHDIVLDSNSDLAREAMMINNRQAAA